MYLFACAPYFDGQPLKPIVWGPIKMSQRAAFIEAVDSVRRTFTKVGFANPDISRVGSSELYLLASGFRMV